MSTYKHYLPQVFPYVIQVLPHQIEFFVGKLVTRSSSFAVTVEDLHRGYYNLWVSHTSMDELLNTDCLAGSLVLGTRGE